jgi:hypothetical protein
MAPLQRRHGQQGPRETAAAIDANTAGGAQSYTPRGGQMMGARGAIAGGESWEGSSWRAKASEHLSEVKFAKVRHKQAPRCSEAQFQPCLRPVQPAARMAILSCACEIYRAACLGLRNQKLQLQVYSTQSYAMLQPALEGNIPVHGILNI